jgi:predicted transposase YbfD/YdcC
MTDWRDEKARIYPLSVLLLSFLLTELAGLRRQRQRARWLLAHWDWILQLCKRHNLVNANIGAPSQSTLSRLCSRCDEYGLKQLYLDGMRKKQRDEQSGSGRAVDLVHYSIDGKSRAGCESPLTGRTEIDLVLLDLKARQALGWMTIPDKEGEATSAQKLFSMFGRKLVRGVLTADAAFASPEFLKRVRRCGHEYIVGLKGNAGKAHDLVAVQDWSACGHVITTEDKAHGRHELRELRMLPLSALSSRKPLAKYIDCGYVLRVVSHRTLKEKTSVETRYFIASRGLKGFTPADFLARIRAHWQHENNFNWAKDAILGEDRLAKHSTKSSRLMGFMKSIVVAIGAQLFGSTQVLVDTFASRPEWTHRLLFETS